MKFLDDVKVINDTDVYLRNNIHKGMVGTIIDAEIRDNSFNVIFVDERAKDKVFMNSEENVLKLNDDIVFPIKIKDLSLIKDNYCSDEKILDALPSNNASWWCKVKDGFIYNLKNERKNKIPYDYNS